MPTATSPISPFRPARKAILLHLAVWVCYALIELFITYAYRKALEPAYVYLTYYSINIGFFYGALAVLHRRRTSGAKRWLSGLIGWISLLLAYLALKLLANACLYGSGRTLALYQSASDWALFAVTTIFRGLVFLVPAIFYRVAGELARTREERLRSELELARSRNAYLRQQLHPHLLFNTLNFVYSQVFRSSAAGARAVELLTEILRYTIREGASDDTVGLELELVQIRNLIEINRYRFGGQLELDLTIQVEDPAFPVIPLILLTLTENIFKHGNVRDPREPARLEIRTDTGGNLHYRAINLKKYGHGTRSTPGLGLQNICSRLDLAYPGRHRLIIRETEHIFELDLTIRLWN